VVAVSLKKALNRLNGMFAFAIWDHARRRLLLARDRLGIKPLFFRYAEGVLTFASELRALRQHSTFDAGIDRAALAGFVRHGYVPGPRSIYAGVWKLQPGHLLVWNEGSIRQGRYWEMKPESVTTPVKTVDEAARQLEIILGDAVERRLVSDVPLGAFLSGGVDSSAVVALMKERASGPVKTFSIGFENPIYDEAHHARRVAEHLGTEHTELYVRTTEAVEVAHEIPDLYDEPFADSSAIPTVLLSRLTRKQVTVALSGDGGDELFGGYRHYHKLHRLLPLFSLPRILRSLLSRVALFGPASSLRNGLLHLRHPDHATLAYGLSSGSGDEPLERLCGPGTAAPNTHYLEAFRRAPFSAPVRRAMVADAQVFLPDDILTKVDRASMSVGLEARVPMLDHHVVSFALGLPLSALWNGGRDKAPLRAIVYRRVPRAMIDRPKKGFSIPIGELLQTELQEWKSIYLAPARLREEGLFHPEGVPESLKEARVRGGAREETALLWRLLCFQRWYERQGTGSGGSTLEKG
jgi:asparagine synthase (glutamine-hydrolysing)